MASVSLDLQHVQAIGRESVVNWCTGYHLKFPNLYKGDFAIAAWFNGNYAPSSQYPQRGQMNALVLGLSESQLADVLVKLANADSTVLRAENAAPSMVIHPFMLIAAILDRFFEEDGVFINKSIDQLKLLQQKISANDGLSMGNLSIELNQLSSDLRATQMGNVYMQSLTKVILDSHCTVKNHKSNVMHPLRFLVKKIKVAKIGADRDTDLESDFGADLSPAENPWLPLYGQFTQIISQLKALGIRCEDRKFDIECLQKQIDINLNVVSTNSDTHRKPQNDPKAILIFLKGIQPSLPRRKPLEPHHLSANGCGQQSHASHRYRVQGYCGGE